MKLEESIFKEFSGVVSITRDEETMYQRAFGYADLANKIANTTETKFATASAGKVFVATAILQLIEQNQIDFDSCIGDILSFDLKAIDPHITISQLLNHTSGIPDYFDESVMENYEDLWKDYPNYNIRTSSDIIPLFIDKPMMYPPGERFQYNNTGFVVLGLIIEAITDAPFDDYLHKHIFNPCGMLDTGYFELDRLPAQCANAYLYDDNKKEFYTNIYSVDVKGTGAGGVFTTVIDVVKFWNALINGQLLSEEMLSKMLAPQVKEECYGYGIWLDKKDDGTFRYHIEGCDPGISFYSSYDKQQDVRITLVSNFGSDVWKLHEHIVELFKEE
ncbi:serine hydrolase domain-containing protein [Gracilibacillus alcaliphilus]|uniref:serine hydrolase domain-containing protein n=1 Tax=Gracilibacillus alcaliphilus TaxID=1401441 RepID=UPI0019589562|nr:serine hydrolase domain-containing protein [Gracilibacillus alcaliphilus]MBM7675321.1 CubicO group peptidase (beta-lactamase class C family) [Gracilibacillus alcaliphilus]